MAIQEAEQTTKEVGYRIRSMYVVSYEMNIQPHEEFPNIFEMIHNSLPTFSFLNDMKSVWIDIKTDIYLKPEKTLCSIKTRTEFDIVGLEIEPIDDKKGKTFLPNHLMYALSGVAIGNTRGMLSLISGGKFLLPVIDLNQFKLTDLTEANEI
jgi:hypothetical protein